VSYYQHQQRLFSSASPEQRFMLMSAAAAGAGAGGVARDARDVEGNAAVEALTVTAPPVNQMRRTLQQMTPAEAQQFMLNAFSSFGGQGGGGPGLGGGLGGRGLGFTSFSQ
jgi:hypothetical protein